MTTGAVDLGSREPADDWQPDVVAVVHDLRTPLSLIGGYARMLADGDLGPLNDAAQRAAEAMTAKVAEMGALLESLLDTARPDAQVLAARRVESLDLRVVAREAVDRALPRARMSGDSVDLVLGGNVPVRADPRLLGRILDNLVNNAISHGRHPGRVVVTVGRRGGYGEVRVQDDGNGLGPVSEAASFEPGVPDRPADRGVPSSGLGLYICRTLAERSGGSLRHERPPEGGAAFIIELPLAS